MDDVSGRDHMGTWGDGTFENDTAMDAADLWDRAVSEGMTPEQAEAHVRQELADLFDLDGEVIEAALAALRSGQRPEFGHEELEETGPGPEPSQEWRDNRRRMTEDLNRRTFERLRRDGYLKGEE
jgi:hypothetical protein